jgi:hypothetical protein
MNWSLFDEHQKKKCSNIMVFVDKTKNHKKTFIISDLGDVLIFDYQLTNPQSLIFKEDLDQKKVLGSVSNLENQSSYSSSKKNFTFSVDVEKLNINTLQTKFDFSKRKIIQEIMRLVYGKNLQFKSFGEFFLGISEIGDSLSLYIGMFYRSIKCQLLIQRICL